MNAFEEIGAALAKWGEDVREGTFPGPQESFTLPEEAREALRNWHPDGKFQGARELNTLLL
jgi:3-methyl-2-oxobutanoate hydroxymethyltransferase